MSQYKKIVALMLIFASVQTNGSAFRTLLGKTQYTGRCVGSIMIFDQALENFKKSKIKDDPEVINSPRQTERETRLIKTGLFTQETVPPVISPIKEYEAYASSYAAQDHIGLEHNECNAMLLHEAGHWVNNDVRNAVILNVIKESLIACLWSTTQIPLKKIVPIQFLLPYLFLFNSNYYERRADNFACEHATIEELIEFYADFSGHCAWQKRITSMPVNRSVPADELDILIISKIGIFFDVHPSSESRMRKIIDAIIVKATPEIIQAFDQQAVKVDCKKTDELLNKRMQYLKLKYDSSAEEINYQVMHEIAHEYKKELEKTDKYNKKQLDILDHFVNALKRKKESLKATPTIAPAKDR